MAGGAPAEGTYIQGRVAGSSKQEVEGEVGGEVTCMTEGHDEGGAPWRG